MRLVPVPVASILAAACTLSTGCVTLEGSTPAEKRASLEAVHQEILTEAYAKYPGLEEKTKAAAGYLAVNTGSIKVLVVGFANGYGLVVDNKTGEKVALHSFIPAVGPGVQVATVRGVIVVEDATTLAAIKEGGWDFGAAAGAAFKFGDFGGAAVKQGLGERTTFYPLFQNGVGLHATVFWARLSPDAELTRASSSP